MREYVWTIKLTLYTHWFFTGNGYTYTRAVVLIANMFRKRANNAWKVMLTFSSFSIVNSSI